MLESWNDMLLDPGSVEPPATPAELFGRDAPLIVEIGFGSGRFLEWLAGERPECNLLGVEISPASHTRAYERIREGGHRNVKLFKGSGEFVVREVLPRGAARRVYVNFPDPWSKKKHRGRRLLTTEFFRTLAGRLVRDGEVRVTTDHADYFEWTLEQASELDFYTVREEASPPPYLGTTYARKSRRAGRSIRHAAFTRTSRAPQIPRNVEVVDTMHHATVEGELPDDLDPSDFETRRLDEGVVAVRDVYERLPNGELLVMLHVEEADLVQRILVEVAPGGGEDGRRITVRVRRFNQPLMTEGTAAAVEHVAEWAASVGADNRIVERQY